MTELTPQERLDEIARRDGQVRIGQVWASNDIRDRKAGRCQRLRVEAVVEDRARMLNLDTGRLTTVSVRRMRPTSTGYRLTEGSDRT